MRLHNATALRLLGAWMVLVEHSPRLLGLPPWQTIPWGHMGLGIFFSLSGYMVSLSAKRSFGAGDFALRRLRRLAPAYLFASLGVVLFLWPWLGSMPASQVLNPPSLLCGWVRILVGGAHWDLPGLFTTHAYPSANGSVWSLPYEVLMYLGLGGLWFLWFKRRLISSKWIRNLAWSGWILSVALMLLGERILPSGNFRLAGFRLLYVLEFFSYFVGGWALAETKWNWWWFGSLFPCLVAARLLLWDHPQIQSLDGILLPLAVVAIGQIEIVRNWRLPDWSYGFYLWAWPVQQCLVEKFPSMSPVRMVVMSTLCTLPAAALSWILVERPFLSLRSPAV